MIRKYTVGLPVLAILFLGAVPKFIVAQNFVQVTDSTNPVVTEPGPTGYNGCAWIDYDNDGDLDLFVNPNTLYRNDGDGAFTHVNGAFLAVSGQGIGCSWADYDNDGNLDVLISGIPCTLYHNNGDGTFTAITEGDIGRRIGNDLRGWSPAWGDYDGDGNVDLIITHPAGFLGSPSLHNLMFHNDGPPNYTFTRITNSDVTANLAPFTVGTWSDFDNDGDLDYFIGSGPATTAPGPDYLFRNLRHESGTATLSHWTSGPIASQNRDGQVYNWIDYDNDGDLDLYITNWGYNMSGGLENELYRHDDTTFTRITTGDIVTDRDASLASVWGDFDNDGDLDCYVTNDAGQTARYYENNGDGTFTSRTNAATYAGRLHSAAAADYDNDGDLDLFVSGVGDGKRLFRNDLNNGNHWLEVRCVGTASNRAAIGAKLRVKATLGGQPVWQLREVSAQNTFNGMNSLVQHFGLRDASVVDTLRIEWPSGQTQVLTGLNSDEILVVTEPTTRIPNRPPVGLADSPDLVTAYPNPFNLSTSISYRLEHPATVRLSIYDLAGRRVTTLLNGWADGGSHVTRWQATQANASGIYFYRLETPNLVRSGRLTLLK